MGVPHATSVEELIHRYSTDSLHGLSAMEVEKRLKEFGLNTLQKYKPYNGFLIFISQFKNSIVVLLFTAALISFYFGDYTNAGAILLVVLINSIIGFSLEIQANRSMQALHKLDRKFSKVLRDNNLVIVESAQIVPGDILFLEAGDLSSADGRVIESIQFEVDESMLTGESIPVEKTNIILPENTILAERKNMVYKGTAVTRGNAHILITATGMETEMGAISEMVEEAQKDEIPLNKKLNVFSQKLILLTVIIILVFGVAGYFSGKDLYLMIETAIVLAVAAIPEGLPIVATIALAKGMFRMSDNKVLVKKLAAVETLGEIDLIMTDKTGTLTENKLEVHQLSYPFEKPDQPYDFEVESSDNHSTKTKNFEKLLFAAVLCNNASIIKSEEEVGDPLETALLRFVLKQNSTLFDELKKWERIYEQPFESESRMMITGHKYGETLFMAMKGSPMEVFAHTKNILIDDEIMPFDDILKKKWMEKVSNVAAKGLKVIAFSISESKNTDNKDNYTFIGLIAFRDPPRKEVPDAMHQCHNAGIRVIMVTGDHSETARSIANLIGLTSSNGENKICIGNELDRLEIEKEPALLRDFSIYSRVNPEQKLRLINYYQNQGNVVAMTGDGVNDAPALKKADVGISMGLRGTEVAREASDMVLQNDSFSSIVKAIKQGRVIFKNIKNFVIYLLSCNLSEILIVGFVSFTSFSLPLLPLQILFLNLVTDVFPALALGMGKGNSLIMTGKFEGSKGPLLSSNEWKSIIGYAIVITLSVLSVYIFSIMQLNLNAVTANNIAFYTLAFAQLFHPISLVGKEESILNNEIIRNKHLWLAILFCSTILVLVYWIEPIKVALNIGQINFMAINLIAIGSVLPIGIIRILKMIKVIE